MFYSFLFWIFVYRNMLRCMHAVQTKTGHLWVHKVCWLGCSLLKYDITAEYKIFVIYFIWLVLRIIDFFSSISILAFDAIFLPSMKLDTVFPFKCLHLTSHFTHLQTPQLWNLLMSYLFNDNTTCSKKNGEVYYCQVYELTRDADRNQFMGPRSFSSKKNHYVPEFLPSIIGGLTDPNSEPWLGQVTTP